MPAELIALTEGPNILLDKPILLLGRHPECDIQIDSRKISRRHCCIAQVEDFLVVRDLGSTNGIRINGVRVQEGRLKPSDELTIGNTRFQVRCDLAAAPDQKVLAPPAAARESRAELVDDDLLESSDEPIPLDDGDQCVPLKAAPAGGPVPAKPKATKLDLDDDEPPDSVILPDDLELAPLSDVVPPPPHN
jgi:pSer/pThr/pTyr-binding forkhead associated (FHA) protein